MKEWSSTVVSPFHIKFELDTNILSYLVDETYPSLTSFIDLMIKSDFVYDITISKYVLYEFIGIRKREHFLRKVLDINKGNGSVNISSLLKFKDSYKTPELDYISVSQEITQLIEDEVSQLATVQGLKVTALHDDIFPPAQSLYLNSTISKEDTLVLVSAIHHIDKENADCLCIITNDGGFNDAFNDVKFEDKINQVFKDYNLKKPDVESIKKLSVSKNLNLTTTCQIQDIHNSFSSLLEKLITTKNKAIYLGKTFSDNCSGIDNVICVQMNNDYNLVLQNPPVLTIIGKSFDFIINSASSIGEFRDKKGKVFPTITSKDSFEDGKLSFEFPLFNEDFEYKDVEHDILSSLKQNGNLVFIHPDSI